MLLIFSLITLKHGLEKRHAIQMQMAADAAATSGAIWEARTYNLIAGMNQGIFIFMTAAFLAAVILLFLIACAATGIGAVICTAILASIGKVLTEIIINSWKIATELSVWERKLVQVMPLVVLGYTHYSGQDNGAKVSIAYPTVPEILGGKHANSKTLTFHTKDGGFDALANKVIEDLMPKIPKKLKKLIYGVTALVDQLLQVTDYPDPLVLDDDFRPRMKHGVFVYAPFPTKRVGQISLSQANVFLPGVPLGEEDLFEMNWHARLEPINFHEDLPEKIQKITENFVEFD